MAAKKKTTAKKKRKPLSAKIRKDLFPIEYIKDFNATRSAIACGYSEKTAKQAGARLLSDVNLQEQIAEALKERIERTKIDADGILLRLTAMLDADPCDIINKTTGAFLPIHEWPLIWRQMLSAADVKELFEWTGEQGEREREKIGELVKYKFIDKLRAIELAGKHVNVQAFAERKELVGNPDKPIEHKFTIEVVDPNHKEPRVING